MSTKMSSNVSGSSSNNPTASGSTSTSSNPSNSISELDLTNATRGVWLVKVPKYISNQWEKAPAKTEVSKLQISKGAGGTPEIKFLLSDFLVNNGNDKSNGTTGNSSTSSSSTMNGTTGGKHADKNSPASKSTAKGVKASLLNKNDSQMISLGSKNRTPTVKNSLIGCKKQIVVNPDMKDVPIPKEHKFAISDISHQHLAVFSQATDEKGVKRLFLEGKVVQKGECRPTGDSLYMDLKKQRIVEAMQPTRHVQQLDKAVVNYKPLSQLRVETEPKKKNEQKKSREDKDKVTEMLFAAFEKHQYYCLKDLETLTKQPIAYLKEILREIATYNLKNPHKNMWELKPEYRHYKMDK